MAPKRTTPAKKTSPAKPAKPTKPAGPFITTSAKAAYEHFLPLAKPIPTKDLEVCRSDVEIARINIDRGIDSLRPELATVKKKLPECPIEEAFELPALALALMFASGKVARPASTREIDQRLAAMRPMREASLKQLEVFALLKLIPAEVPTGIRKGSGSLDNARDAVAIPGAFHDHKAAIAGKHPFTPAMLQKLGQDGDWLVQQLKPKGTKVKAAKRDPASIVRDQLWAIINARHEHLRQAGAVVFGLKNLDEHVPPLGARAAAGGGGAKSGGEGPLPPA